MYSIFIFIILLTSVHAVDKIDKAWRKVWDPAMLNLNHYGIPDDVWPYSNPKPIDLTFPFKDPPKAWWDPEGHEADVAASRPNKLRIRGSPDDVHPPSGRPPKVDKTWHPANGTEASCDFQSGVVFMSLGTHRLEVDIHDACVDIMPNCLDFGAVDHQATCENVTTWGTPGPSGPKRFYSYTDIQHVLTKEIEEGWVVAFTLYPPPPGTPLPSSMFKFLRDCQGYFITIANELPPDGCRRTGHADLSLFRPGNITVGKKDGFVDGLDDVTFSIALLNSLTP